MNESEDPTEAIWAENIFKALAERLQGFGDVRLEQGEDKAECLVTFAESLAKKTIVEAMVEIAHWKPDETDLTDDLKIRLWWDDLKLLADTL